MAKKVYTDPIDYKNRVDWGVGNSTTENLPLSGGVVQKYIQDNFDHKAGYFYSDETAGKCYVFANREDWEKWYKDEDQSEDSTLLVGIFNITTNFVMNVRVDESESKKSAAAGSTGNEITFSWYVLNTNSNTHTTEDANCTLTFYNNINRTYKYKTFRIPNSQSTYTMNVDEFLSTGVNEITIAVTGITSKVSNSSSITYNIIALDLSSTYDISQTYDINDTIYIPYTLKATANTFTEWWWDGIKLREASSDTYYPSTGTANMTKSIPLNDLSNWAQNAEVTSGLHTLQARTYIISDYKPFYTDTLYFDIVINNIGNELESPVFPIKTRIPKEIFDPNYAGKKISLYGMSQYVPYDLTLSTYYPGDASYIESIISIDGMDTVYTERLEKGKETTIQIVPTISGETKITISSEESSREIEFEINKNSLGLEELNELYGLEINFAADGRTNTSLNRDEWSYKDYTATIEGFQWTTTSGWNNGRLLLNKGASVEINGYLPFSKDISQNGYVLELEYSTFNVTDDNAIICSTYSEDTKTGIILTATEAKLKSSGQEISVKYKREENVRIAFSIEPNATNGRALMFVYMNGILSGASAWTSSDSLYNIVPLKFIGSEGASINLKQIRGYNRYLSSDQILNNYILYRESFAEMRQIFERNDIYDNGQISPDKLAKFIPVMLVTGDIPHVDSLTSATKSNITLMPEVRYIDYIYNKSFVYKNAAMSCQGTSSMTYPKKNYRLYTEEKKFRKDITWPVGAKWEYDPDHTGFFTMNVDDISNEKNWIELPWSGKKEGKHKVYYAFRDKGDYENGTPMGVSRWTIKADFAESSGTHNVGVARLWNNVMYNAYVEKEGYLLRTKAQQFALNENYGYDVRTCIDGVPIVMFYRASASEPYTFMGKYNFNNDKSNEEVFGFKDIESFDKGIIDPTTLRDGQYVRYEFDEKLDDGTIKHHDRECNKYEETMQCWELLDSGNPISLFRRTDRDIRDYSILEMGYEARYPDDAGEDAEDKRWRAFVQPLYEWMCDVRDECVITRDENNRIVDWVNASRFATEKWQWFDVYKMAAYYIYLIRCGAVDQVVKNAMLTSEDGQHWYYINYDNDTIFGLNNLGDLVFQPTITRSTMLEGQQDFDYAARESTLWNCLESDREFMEEIVPKVDNALRTAGFTYEGVIKTFDTDGGDSWCETVYNKDAEYKYVDSYRNGDNYLGSMQGARKTHRRWWVSTRFDFYDGKFQNDEWNSKYFLVNAPGAVSPNNTFTVTAGTHGFYGTFADMTFENRVELEAGEKATMFLQENVQIGRNYQVLNVHNMSEINLVNCSKFIAKLEASRAYDENLGCKVKRLILGSDDSIRNTTLFYDNFKGLEALKYLEELNVQNYAGLTGIDGIEKMQYLKKFDARGSGIRTLSFAKGAPLQDLALPSGIQSLVFDELPLLSTNKIYFDDGGVESVTSLSINNCENLLDSWNWVKKFTRLRDINLQINWGEKNPIKWDELKEFLTGKVGELRGTIQLSKEGLPNDIIEELFEGEFSNWFGPGCLDENNKLYVKLPKNVYLKLSNYTITEGLGPYLEDGRTPNPDYDPELGHTYLSLFFVGFDSNPSVRVGTTNAYSDALSINENTYEIYAHETYFNTDTAVTIYARFDGGPSQITLNVKNKVYPNNTNTSIVGDNIIYADNKFGDEFSVSYSDEIKGKPNSLLWRIDPNDEGSQYITIENETEETCIIKLHDNGDDKFESMYTLSLYLDINNPDSENDVTLVKSLTISYIKGAIVSESSNPMLWEALKRGLVDGFDKRIEEGIKAFTTENAERVVKEEFHPERLFWDTDGIDEYGDSAIVKTGVTNFNEFVYFTNLFASDGVGLFANNPVLAEITLPNTWRTVPSTMFYRCTNLTDVHLDAGIEDIIIDASTFEGCSKLKNVDLGNNISAIGSKAFYQCVELTEINLTERLNTLGHSAFYGCTSLLSVNLGDNVEDIGNYAFYNCSSLTEVRIPENESYTTIGMGTFYFCRNLREIQIPDNITKIEETAFATTALESIDTNKVEYIGRQAFYGCNLKEVYLSQYLDELDKNAFGGNSMLRSFTGDSKFNPVKFADGGLSSDYLICDPVESEGGSGISTTYTLLQIAGGISSFTFPGNIKKIAPEAFFSSLYLREIEIPDGVSEIGDGAFSSCNSLTKVVLPYGFTIIPRNCFSYCSQLRTIYTRTSDGSDVDFNDLRTIKILSSSAFSGCTSLTNLYFRDLETVEDYAFYRCLKLGDLTIENSTPPTIAGYSTEVFGDPASKFSSYQTLTGAEVIGDKIFSIPSGSKDAYRATKWYNLFNPEICEFIVNDTL